MTLWRRFVEGLGALWDSLGAGDAPDPASASAPDLGHDDPGDIVMCSFGEDETVWIPMDVLNGPLEKLREQLTQTKNTIANESFIELRAQLARVEEAVKQARRS